jgi:TPR repeat protein
MNQVFTIERNYKTAAHYFQLACKKGSLEGKWRVAACMKKGFGIPFDFFEHRILLLQAYVKNSISGAIFYYEIA